MHKDSYPIDKEKLHKFFTNYTFEYKEYIEKNHPDRKQDFRLYHDFPYF